MNEQLIDKISENLLNENTLHVVHEESVTGLKLDNNKQITLAMLQEAGKASDVDLLLNIEQLIVKNERDYQANDPAAINTLKGIRLLCSLALTGG